MSTIEHSFVRSWAGTPADLLDRLRGCLQAAGFILTSPSYWTLHGEIGSSIALTKLDLPLTVDALVAQDGEGAITAHVHLADRMPIPLPGLAMKRNLETRFGEIERALDAALASSAGPAVPPTRPADRAVEPVAPRPAEQMVQPAQGTPAVSEGLADRTGTALERLTAKTQDLTSRTQERATAVIRRRTAEPWQKVEEVVFWCPPDRARADAARIQVYAAIASMVASQPGSLPANLAEQLTAFVEQIRSVLDAAGTAGMERVRSDVDQAQRPILDFLEQQALMREDLPVRTLHVCRDCGQQKVSNPDYQKLKERNRKMQALSGAVGVTLRKGSVSPFVLAGALFRLRNLDPDYVCPRCQGMEADESIATFCPECGDLRSEAVLKKCHKCGHDFRGDLAPLELWHPIA